MVVATPVRIGGGGGLDKFCRYLNFRQIFHRFTLSFTNTPFQVLKAWSIVYKNMKILNPSECNLALHLN